jgi:hypothetical protein
MFTSRSEVTEAGKEIENVMEIVAPEWKSNVMQEEMQIFILEFESLVNTFWRDVSTRNVKSVVCQDPCMTAFPTGRVQYSVSILYFQMFTQSKDEIFRFFFIPVEIEFMIERGIEPISEPFDFRHIPLI